MSILFFVDGLFYSQAASIQFSQFSNLSFLKLVRHFFVPFDFLC